MIDIETEEENFATMTSEQLIELFEQFQPRDLMLETIYVPFLQSLQPSIGDVDPFVKIPRPDNQAEQLGLVVLDEPCIDQSDPQLLNIKLQNVFNITLKSENKEVEENIKSLKKIDKKAIEAWVKEVENIHQIQGPANYNYTLIPPADTILQLWDNTMEQVLQQYEIPRPNIELNIYDYACFCCMLLDIPIGDNIIESLHMFFQNYSDIINQQNQDYNFQINQDPEIKLQIHDVSSQEPDFPAINVLNNDPLSQGWRSQKYSPLPQEIIFKLPYSQISQIQFVLHEICTPDIIEVYICKNQEGNEFIRLGHVKRNTQTNKNCRERKTLKIKVPARYVKFVISQVKADDNLYNQCSLCAVCIRGIPLDEKYVEQPDNNIETVQQNSHIRLAEDIKQELQLRKQQQIQLQNYLEANRFKIAIDKITSLQNALEQLEIKKAIAIEKEDFIAANDMKINIEQIERVLEMPVEQMIHFCNGEKYDQSQYTGNIRRQQTQRQQEQVTKQLEQTQQTQQQPQSQQIQNPQQLDGTQNMQDMIPQQGAPIIHEEQAIQANKGWMQVDDKELKELERERRQRALQKLKEREERIGNKVTIQEPQNKNQQVTKVQENTNQIGDQLIYAYKEYDFKFEEQQQSLLQYLNPEPTEIPKQFDGSEEIQVLQNNNIQQDIITILTGKHIEHIQAVVNWFITLLRVQPVKYQQAAYACISILLKSQNIALLGLKEVMQLIFYFYIATIYKNTYKLDQQIELDVEMLDIDNLLANQKDQAVIVAELTAYNKTSQNGDIEALIQDSIQQNQASFNNDIIPLINQLVNRVSSGQKRPRLVAINIIATLAGFPGFPGGLVYQQLLTSKLNVEGQKNMKNIKYANVVEQRVSTASMTMQENIYLAENQQVQAQIYTFIKELLPQITKSECKNNIIQMMQIIFQQVQDIRFLVEAINYIDSAPLLKQIVQKLNDKRKILEYQEQQNKVIITGNIEQQNQEQQNECQFCLKQFPENIQNKQQFLKEHLIKECSCCCICPACHSVVEIAIIYQHIIQECKEKNNWFKRIETELQLCPKCQLGIPKAEYNKHIAECNIELKTEDSALCPLCQTQMSNVEETLDHYCQNMCNANPRTSQKLLQVIQNKVDKM